MKIQIKGKNFKLRPYRRSDAKILAKNINDRIISRNTSNIPFPYKLKDALLWLDETVAGYSKKSPEKFSLAIVIDNEVVGTVGMTNIVYGHKAILGYWLARKYWGQGIMTEAVKIFTKFVFKKFHLVRMSATVFPFNLSSQKVLRKCGFKLEGLLKKNQKKDGKILDVYLFAKINRR